MWKYIPIDEKSLLGVPHGDKEWCHECQVFATHSLGSSSDSHLPIMRGSGINKLGWCTESTEIWRTQAAKNSGLVFCRDYYPIGSWPVMCGQIGEWGPALYRLNAWGALWAGAPQCAENCLGMLWYQKNSNSDRYWVWYLGKCPIQTQIWGLESQKKS